MADDNPLLLGDGAPVDLHDVDDLFGDNVNFALPMKPQCKQLLARLDEMRTQGCCQSVAWSKGGTIASVSQDGLTLQLRFLRGHPESGSWDLSEPTTCEYVKGSPAAPLIHLEWAPTSTSELAVLDATGRVAILSFPICLNSPFYIRPWDADNVDDSNAVVGCHWLAVAPSSQQKSYNVLYGPARRHGNGYQYESSFIHAGGPFHPHPAKSALLCVTMGGMLKMYWSQNNSRVEETTIELESINSSDQLLTHAALVSDKRFLIVAIATADRSLKVFRLEIQWGGPGSSSDNASMPQNARLNPMLVETHLSSTSWLQSGPSEASHDASMAQLSQLHVLPSLLDNTGKGTAPPMVVSIRSRPAVEGSYQTAQSILDRWQVVEQRQALHPAFVQLGNRRNSVPSELPVPTKLRKLDPVVINKVVVGFQTIQFGKVLVLAMSDGSVEFRSRFTFEEVYTTEDFSRFMNLRQVGWTFADEWPCQQVAFSPTLCSMIQVGDDGKIRWSRLHYPAGDIGDSMQEVHYAASIAGLAVTAASAMWYQSNYDDMLAIVQPFTSKRRFTQDWVGELIRILKIQVDYSEEMPHDSLMRNSPLQSSLSIMSSLGFRGEMRRRSFQSKFATLNLNVRNVVILISLASNTPTAVRDKMSPLDEPEVVGALAGCAKWCLDLVAWLLDSLFGLVKDDEFMQRVTPQLFTEMTAYLEERNEVSLYLVLCSCSRSFLSAMCRRVAHLEALSNKAIEFYRRQSAMTEQAGGGGGGGGRAGNPKLQQAYQRMQQATSSGLVKVGELEKLLNSVGADVRTAYQTLLPSLIKGGPNAPQGKQLDAAVRTAQGQFEVGLLLGTSPPPVFWRVISNLLTHEVPRLRLRTDPARLFFADYRLLGFDDNDASLAQRAQQGGVYVDVFRRAELRAGASGLPWRRCTRCAAVMENVPTSRPGITFVLSQLRRCSCGGAWGLLPAATLVL